MLSWSRTTERETLDLADYDLSLSKKEGFAKTIQFLSDREAQN
jgi:hypothetical protein